MKNLKTYLIIFFVSTLGLIPFVPSFSAIDLTAPQYLYLSITQLIISFYLIFTSKKELVSINIIDVLYVIFLFLGLLSFHKSFNLTESYIEWSQFLTLFITYFNLKVLFKKLKNRAKVFLVIMITLLVLESLKILYVFIDNYTFEFGIARIPELAGFSSNVNIGAFSVLIKVPFVLFLFYKSKKYIHKFLLLFLFTISCFDILISLSRGAIYGLIFVIIGMLMMEILKTKDHNFKFKLSSVFIPLLIGVFILQAFLFNNNKDSISINRISSLNDFSTTSRIDYFDSAINLFLENPIFGIGIGNWKVVSIKNLGDKMIGYFIPFHTHNDFLQIASEIGFLGFICFLLIVILPILYLINRFFKKRELNEIAPFLLMAISIYFLDSNINFPRIRPYSQMNFIFILSFFSSNYELKTLNKKIEIKKIMMIFLVLIIPLNFIHATIFSSYKEIATLYLDYNENGNQLEAPIELIDDFQDSFPNITNATIPIKLAKANYFLQKKEYSKAKQLIIEGQMHNPYLGFGDFLMARIYLEEKQLDSALYFIEKAYDKIPANTGHVAVYQGILKELKMTNKLNEIFERTKFLNDELIWINHFSTLMEDSTKVLNKSFSKNDEIYAKEAINLFPDNVILKSVDLIINKGVESVEVAVNLDVKADEYYNNAQYELAIDNWTLAAKIVDSEDSYYLNIALSYCQLKEFNKALNILKIIEKKGISKSKDGMFEFLGGYSFWGLNKFDLACKYLKVSSKMGNISAANLLKTINCQTK